MRYLKEIKTLKAHEVSVVDMVSHHEINNDTDYHGAIAFEDGEYVSRVVKDYDDGRGGV